MTAERVQTTSGVGTSIDLNELDGFEGEAQARRAMDLGLVGWDGDAQAAESSGGGQAFIRNTINSRAAESVRPRSVLVGISQQCG